MHAQQPVDAFAFALVDVEEHLSLFNGARVEPEETEAAGFLVVLDLEHQAQGRGVFVAGDVGRLVVFDVVAGNGG